MSSPPERVRLVSRVLFALAGSVIATLAMALAESWIVAPAGFPLRTSIGALFALLLPIGLGVGAGLGPLWVLLEPYGPRTWGEHARAVAERPLLARLHLGGLGFSALALAPFLLAWVAHEAAQGLATGKPNEAGAYLAIVTVGALLLYAALVFLLAGGVRRVLAMLGSSWPGALHPFTATYVGGVVGLAVFALGVRTGDTSGDGGFLAIFGVFKRRELDLRPALGVIAMAVSSYLAPILLSRTRRVVSLLVTVACVFSPLALMARTARSLDASLAIAIERQAPLGGKGLSLLRKVTDRDHDGASPFFAGGDCDDHDRNVSPMALDIPGNGIDEDCSGSDLVLAAAPKPRVDAGASVAPEPRVAAVDNVIFITVDTLRTDVGFMGYPKPVTPELDALAARGVIFERMYALASYTGKSIGPLMIGRYPSETRRDGNHFNTYMQSNVMLAERLKEQGVRTLGATSLWYFAPWSGLSQGFDVWDLSARPPGGGDKDNYVTSDKVSDAALRILQTDENTKGRFFLWLHYFDPHAEYLAHDGAPASISADANSATAKVKALYDGEVWFTDREIGRVLRFVAEQPWGKKTAIIVTADHGEAFNEHSMSWHGRELWEPLVRVPFVLTVPGASPHRVPVKRSHIDVVPTVLDLMGFQLPEDLSGVSMMNDVSRAAQFEERDVYIDMPEGPFNPLRRALIVGESPGKKLVHLGGQQFQLFDLAADPDERSDLARDPDVLRPMVDQYQAQRARTKEIYVAPVAGPQ